MKAIVATIVIYVVLLFVCRTQGAAVVTEYLSRETHEEVVAYWTEERMQNAKPLILEFTPPTVEFKQKNASKRDESEESSGEPPVQAVLYPPKIYETAKRNVVTDYSNVAWSFVGKVFATFGSTNFVCTAALMDVYQVSTAGHCVYKNGVWATNWMFVPAYNNGNRPFGTWVAYSLSASAAWISSASICKDYAIVLLHMQTGLGASQIAGGYFGGLYNAQPIVNLWRVVDYPVNPAASEYSYFEDTVYLYFDSLECTPNPIGIYVSENDIEPTGGPWILYFSTAGGYINGVSSYKNAHQPYTIYSPYFDDAWAAYVTPLLGRIPPFN